MEGRGHINLKLVQEIKSCANEERIIFYLQKSLAF